MRGGAGALVVRAADAQPRQLFLVEPFRAGARAGPLPEIASLKAHAEGRVRAAAVELERHTQPLRNAALRANERVGTTAKLVQQQVADNAAVLTWKLESGTDVVSRRVAAAAANAQKQLVNEVQTKLVRSAAGQGLDILGACTPGSSARRKPASALPLCCLCVNARSPSNKAFLDPPSLPPHHLHSCPCRHPTSSRARRCRPGSGRARSTPAARRCRCRCRTGSPPAPTRSTSSPLRCCKS